MKKFLKIFGISFIVLIALLVLLPVLFKGKIIEQVKVAINQQVDARVDFGTFRLSFIRSFPDVSFRLNDLSVVGINEFEGDSLASIESFFITVNLRSFFGNDGFEIKTIRLDQPRLLLRVLEDGKVNWDIAKVSDTSEEPEVQEEVSDDDFDFRLALRRFQINNAHIVYDDREMNMYSRIEGFNHTLSGDFTADFTSLSIRNTFIESLYFSYEGIPFLNGVFAEFTADIDADLTDFSFTFRDNSFRLNDLLLIFEGNFAMPDDDMVMDFTFSSPQTAFKSFLSLVPAVYAQDFEGLETQGSLAFNGYIRGVLDDDNIPGFGLTIQVADGMFQYPDLPAAVTDVIIDTRIHNPGGDADLTVIDVSRFSLNMGGNPVDMRLNLKTPVSDPQIDASLRGKINLSRVGEFFPLDEGEAMKGIIESNMVARGRMSSIENERYDEFVFTGSFSVSELKYSSEAFPHGVEVMEARMEFSPQFASVPVFRTKIGNSDLAGNGRIDNVLGFVLNDELLTGRFETRSELFDLNQFMEGEEPEPDPDQPLELSVIEVPANIDFDLRSRFDKILFGELEITNVTGGIKVADQTVSMDDLRMSLLGGNLLLNGSYATHDATAPIVDFGLQITGFDVARTFNTFNTFAAIAPLGERTSGRFSAGFTLRSVLDEQLNPILATLAGGGNFSSAALAIENSPALVGLAENLRMDMFRAMNVRDVNIDFSFRDGRVEVMPFTMNMGRSSATVSGNHGFDQTINYMMSLAIPRAEFGGTANQVLDNLLSHAAGRGLNVTLSETVNVGVAFTGTVTEPRIRVTLAETAEDTRQQMMDLIEETVQQVIDDIKDQAQEAIGEAVDNLQEELEKRAQRVLDEAQRQATRIRNEAGNAAQNIRREAREQAQRLEDEASGPVAKAAARRAGEQLIRNADERADRLEREADQRADQLINEANQQADRIRAGEE